MTGLKRSILSITILLVFFLVTAGYLAESFLSGSLLSVSDESQLFSSLFLFLLINLNIIVILFLVFLMIKNIVKLVLERKRNILGSALRTRLVLAFVGLSFFPTIVLFLIARGIIGSVMDGLFSPQMGQSFERLQNVARVYYDTSERNFRYQILSLEEQVGDSLVLFGYQSAKRDFFEITSKEAFERYLEAKRAELGLAEIVLMSSESDIIARAVDLKLARRDILLPEPNKAKIQEVKQEGLITRAEQSFSHEFIRGYTKIALQVVPSFQKHDQLLRTQKTSFLEDDVILVATYLVPPELSVEFSQLMSNFDDYFEIRSYRRPVTSSYLLLLVGGTFLIIFVAIWVGFRLAANISEPIKLLAEGTQQLAKGNLSYTIPHVGDDELGTLVESFNLMTSDLKKITDELVGRRIYMETVLASVDIGVLSLDAEQRVTTINKAAAQIMFLSKPDNVIGKPAKEIVAKDIFKRFIELYNEMEQTEEEVRGTITVSFRSDIRHVEIVLTPLFDSSLKRLGTVVLMDDLSELVKAQRMAAWRDVARRIAHEIKNPLTPIQLSAQRIQRRFAKKMSLANAEDSQITEDYLVLKDCTNTIVSQVQTLRNLVNEFSRFARMPKASYAPVDMNELIIPLERMYQEAHPSVVFKLELDEQVPVMDLDKDQINRAIINLFDNAITAVKEYFGESLEPKGQESPLITVRTSFDDELGIVALDIEDNGVGIKNSERSQVFEPYFSSKKGGTGLGLAIVASIVSDHNGFVRVRDNAPHGAIFIIELPSRRVTGS